MADFITASLINSAGNAPVTGMGPSIGLNKGYFYELSASHTEWLSLFGASVLLQNTLANSGATSMRGVLTTDIANALPAHLFSGPAVVVQAGCRLAAVDQDFIGVLANQGPAQTLPGVGVTAMIYRASGVPKVFVNNYSLAATSAVNPVSLPVVSGPDYCVRLITKANGYCEVWVACMDWLVNPNAAFFKVLGPVYLASALTAGGAGLATYKCTADANSGFINPQAPDGSYPYQFFVWSHNDGESLPTAQDTTKPYGAGWINTRLFDFSVSSKYIFQLPELYGGFSLKFRQLEFVNTGNLYDVTLKIGLRQLIIPAGRTVVVELDPSQFNQYSVECAQGAMRINGYAGTRVQYQTIN